MNFVEQGPILALAAGAREDRRLEYRRYVEAGLARNDEELAELLKESPRAMGSRDFRKWVYDEYRKLKDKQGSVEIVARAFGVGVVDMRRRMRVNLARPVAAQMLFKRLAERLIKDAKPSKKIRKIEREISKLD